MELSSRATDHSRRSSHRAAGCRKHLGHLLSLAPVALFSVLLTTSQAQTNFQQILAFGPSVQSGSSPRAPLMEGSDGLLYGTTYGGGSNGSGTVFKIGKDGTGFTQLYSSVNADFPCGGLVEMSDGTLCGTTSSGGSNYSGTVFKMAKDGSGFVLLHTFSSGTGDGVQPVASLARGNSNVLYGTTFTGGAANQGTVFSLNPDGSGYSILYSFTGATNSGDGSYPFAGLCLGSDAALYGTTQGGGSNDLGSVFRLNSDGTGYAVLHHFSGGPTDGRKPYGSLVQGGGGLLYGTTYAGGTNDTGTVFQLNTDGSGYVVLWSFAADSTGIQPFAGLIAASNGVLYGTTRFGGSNGGGTVFRLNTDGTGYTTLHGFGASSGDGSQPLAGLLLGSDGALYGSTYWGGGYATNGVSGTLFRMFSTQPQITITSITPSSSGLLISFAGGASAGTYQIQATTNTSPSMWQTIGSGTAAIDGTFQFLDSDSTNLPSRFYRSCSW